MTLDGIKKIVKSNPRLECLFMCFSSLKNEDQCKKIIGVKRNPYNIIVNNFGDKNSDKWIYYINFDKGYKYNGFCSLYRLMLLHLAYADDLSLVPVVNWGENTLYFDKKFNGNNNAFEYYFLPVSNVSFSDVLYSRRVTISKGLDMAAFGTNNSYLIPDDEIELAARFRKKYIILKPDIKLLFWDRLQDYISGGKTLGVHVRATDFNKGYNRHPIAVTPEEYLSEAKNTMEKYGFTKVFLATDDESVISLFKKEFGNLLVYYDNICRSKDRKAIHYGNTKNLRDHHKYLLGLEIIMDFYTLGSCTGLIAGNSNVSICARILKESNNECYQYLKIIDKGINHNMKETRSVFGRMLSK